MENATQTDPLDSFEKLANHDPRNALMLVLWKLRHDNPDFTHQITERDLEGFTKCVDYLEVTPQIKIHRPRGLPAQDPVPAHGNRKAVPGRSAGPDKPFVVVQMIDTEGNAIVPIEDNEDDQRLGKQRQEVSRAREKATLLADQLLQDIRQNTIANSMVQEAAGLLKTLARA